MYIYSCSNKWRFMLFGEYTNYTSKHAFILVCNNPVILLANRLLLQ